MKKSIADQLIVEILIKEGITPVLSVPCKMLSGILHEINVHPIQHIPVCREEEGVGIAAGAALAGKKPLLLMQNSGLGNSINALMSLTSLYKLPLFLLMSNRGEPGEKISAQIPMGKSVPELLQVMDIHYMVLKSLRQLTEFAALLHKTFDRGEINAVFLSKHLWNEAD